MTVSFFCSAAAKYTPDQIRKMKESVRIRGGAEPFELVKLVCGLFRCLIYLLCRDCYIILKVY